MQRIRWFFPSMMLGVSVAFASVGYGQTADKKKRADELFAGAVKLRQEKNFVAACPLLEQAQALDPTEGTLFALADCRQQEGQLATALQLYRRYIDNHGTYPPDAPEKRILRIRSAHERIKALEAEAPRLKVVWQGQVPADVKVFVDGAAFVLNEAKHFDPGEHLIVVERAGLAAETRTVTLEKGQLAEADLTPPPVIDIPKVQTQPDPITSAPQEKKTSPPRSNDLGSPVRSAPTNAIRTSGVVLLGAGGVGLIAGGVLGAQALSRWETVNRECTTDALGKACSPLGLEAQHDGRGLGNAATAPLLLGTALVATGIVLVVRVPKTNASVRSSVSIHRGSFFMVEGVF